PMVVLADGAGGSGAVASRHAQLSHPLIFPR
ncbi:MAG: hypothetical protein RL707_1107, partial [Pseudomonadota bacterium]